MSLITRITVVAACAVILVPFRAHAQTPAPAKDTVVAHKADSAAAKDSAATDDNVDLSTLTGFYEIVPGKGLTITLENGTLFGAPSTGEKKKLIYKSGLAFTVEGTKMTLSF